MSEREIHESVGAATDPSIEFDILEMARLRLVEALMSTGRPALDAERIALYAIEGLRHVPRLMRVLTRLDTPPPAEVLDALRPVLDEAFALEKAKGLLLGLAEDRPGANARTGRRKKAGKR